MPDFLSTILTAKRREVEARKNITPLAEWAERCRDQNEHRCFAEVLRREAEITVIAEIKKASPSAGVIRDDVEPEAVARTYADHGAAAISILTERHFFQGDIGTLRRVRQVVELPLLCKDFFIDPYQVVEARAHGADAVLLIVAALEEQQLAELHQLAMELGMEALVEVHDEDELRRAQNVGASLVGINNRDLVTFAVNPEVARRLGPLAAKSATVVAESGIKTSEDVAALSGCGIDAVLIGEALMRSADIGAALERFIGFSK